MVQGFTKQQVCEHFYKALTLAYPDAHITILSDEFIQFKHASGLESNLHLGNLHQDYLSGRRPLNNLLSDHLASIAETINNHLPQQKGAILPVIKCKDFLAAAQQQMQQHNTAALEIQTSMNLAWELLVDELMVFYAYDGAQGIRYLSDQDAANEPSLKKTALENLLELCRQHPTGLQALNLPKLGPVYQFKIDGHYDASILVSPQLIASVEKSLGDTPIIFVPARDMVLVAAKNNAQAVQTAAQLAQKAFSELPYAISPNGYSYEGASVVRCV